jgi:hypothetical protein
MKTLFYLLTIALLLSCGKEQSTYDAAVSAAIDVTDSVEYDADQIFTLTGLQDDMNRGVCISIITICDGLHSCQTKNFSIEGGNSFADDPDLRKARVQKLKKDLEQYLMTLRNTAGRGHTVFHSKVAGALNALAAVPAQERNFVICSDGMQHDQVSFYAPDVFRDLQNHPEKIRELLEHQAPIGNLSGINIRWRYTPKNYQQDKIHQVARAFFMDMYARHGAVAHRGNSIELR